jgi:hypothetical protein
MENNPNDELLKKLVIGEVISTSPADISISVSGKSGEQELIFSQAIPSDIVASTTVANSGIELNKTCAQKLSEKIEEVKACYTAEVEAKLGPLSFKIKRAPQKTTTRYTEQKRE